MIVITVALFMVWASADVGSGVYLHTVCRKQTDRPYVALTFDDGPDETMTPRVLDILGRHGIKATFFVVGEKVRRYPDLVRRMVDEGHTVGNHTLSHSPMFPLWGRERVTREIEQTQRTVKETAGVRMRFFRPPFGITNPVIGRAVRQSGLQAIGWSIRSFDTVACQERSEVCRRITKRLHNGAVILLHDRCEGGDVLLEELLEVLADKEMEVVGLEKMFGI